MPIEIKNFLKVTKNGQRHVFYISPRRHREGQQIYETMLLVINQLGECILNPQGTTSYLTTQLLPTK
jgi:hypothetical protein